MTPSHAIKLIAQEWETFKLRLDSAYPGARGQDGYLGGLVESQRLVMDRCIDEATSVVSMSRGDQAPDGALRPD